MMLTIDRGALVDALRTVMPAVLRSGTSIPVLGGVRIHKESSLVKLAATNLDLTIHTEIESADSHTDTDGAVVLPAHLLLNVVASMAGETVTLMESSDGVTVSVMSGDTEAHLRTFDATTWPNVTEADGEPVMLDVAALDALSEAVRFVSPEASHGAHTGVYFGPEGIMATDRYRAMLYAPDGVTFPEAIVPGPAAQAIAKAGATEMAMAADGNRASFTTDGTTWTTALLSGDYPRAGLIKAMGAEAVSTLMFDRAELAASLARIASLGDTRVYITYTDGTTAVVAAQTQEVGAITDTIWCGPTGDPPPLTYETVKLVAIVDALDDDEITLQLPAGTGPTVVRSGDLSMLLAPLKPTA